MSLELNRAYAGVVRDFNADDGVITVSVPLLWNAAKPIEVRPFVPNQTHIEKIYPVSGGDFVLIFFPSGENGPPMWIPQRWLAD